MTSPKSIQRGYHDYERKMSVPRMQSKAEKKTPQDIIRTCFKDERYRLPKKPLLAAKAFQESLIDECRSIIPDRDIRTSDMPAEISVNGDFFNVEFESGHRFEGFCLGERCHIESSKKAIGLGTKFVVSALSAATLGLPLLFAGCGANIGADGESADIVVGGDGYKADTSESEDTSEGRAAPDTGSAEEDSREAFLTFDQIEYRGRESASCDTDSKPTTLSIMATRDGRDIRSFVGTTQDVDIVIRIDETEDINCELQFGRSDGVPEKMKQWQLSCAVALGYDQAEISIGPEGYVDFFAQWNNTHCKAFGETEISVGGSE